MADPASPSILIGTRESNTHQKLVEHVFDGVHLSTKGYQLLYNEIRASIADEWEERDIIYPRKYPYWKDSLSQAGSANLNLEDQYPQFILFGDSQIEFCTHIKDGFSLNAQLQSDFARRLDVINRGFSGYNTTQAQLILPSILKGRSRGSIRYILILFGSNDSSLPRATGQHVDLETYISNLKSIITYSKLQEDRPRILLVTPPPIDEPASEETEFKKSGSREAVRSAALTQKYAIAARELGEELNRDPKLDVVLIDLWKKIEESVLS